MDGIDHNSSSIDCNFNVGGVRYQVITFEKILQIILHFTFSIAIKDFKERIENFINVIRSMHFDEYKYANQYFSSVRVLNQMNLYFLLIVISK